MSQTRKIIGFIGLILAMFMGALDATIVNIALPDIMKDLGTNLTNTSWVATIYVLAMASFIITAAKLADILGRKKVMLLGIILFGGFSFACMTAKTLNLLIIYRFFQGIGGAILTPIVLPMGIELFGKANTSKITAFMGAFSALAAAGGPAIGGFIINYSNYHWIFGINVPIAVIAFIMVLLGTGESYDTSIEKSVDWFGVVLLTVFLGSLCFGLLEGHEYGWASKTIVISFVTSGITLVLLLLTELKVKSPIINLELFREKTFTSSCIIYMVFGFAIIGPSLILNYFLQNVKNYSALHSAYLIIPASLAISVGMPLATKMYKVVSSRLLVGIGLIVTSGGLAMLGLLKTSTSSSIIVCCNIIIGLGLGFTAIAMTSSVKFLPVDKTGIGSGVVNAARYIGQALGMALLVTILNNSVITAKNNIRTVAYNQINERVLSRHVKKVAREQIEAMFDNDSNNNTHTKQQIMQRKIKRAAKFTNGLPIPRQGTSYRKLYLVNQKLTTGTQQLENIPQLKNAVAKVNAGQSKIGTGIKLLAQREQLIQALNKIKSAKNYQLAHAFSKVFNITALITLIACPLAKFTDKELSSPKTD
ncbi:DHA2 family efflux MFS transporter permease subunit [Limosilactobacillus sp. STM2_1]|uniref:DHA2 family efflux MFS transporter permease subunit n=1 Tax=Limosilactobacillus rudii TaxID=2759755 RepID=A0A7W3UMI5_9LACO|nr:DHA2 family efflux MFS transporter permease subunit [Limosilactobacillus rudii]MBB1079745.1 DHA2 family efflux MFS transporter permease subunit [Limosilactobacillus rudii]MBB1097795.1 DHA2 family efflux MFS transporter permease subunit [Limosilactobacillus rudii]MCD7134876.1 DHA2 family efflux MFS transporter permease subunit [Limosilactobacillus rudii]